MPWLETAPMNERERFIADFRLDRGRARQALVLIRQRARKRLGPTAQSHGL